MFLHSSCQHSLECSRHGDGGCKEGTPLGVASTLACGFFPFITFIPCKLRSKRSQLSSHQSLEPLPQEIQIAIILDLRMASERVLRQGLLYGKLPGMRDVSSCVCVCVYTVCTLLQSIPYTDTHTILIICRLVTVGHVPALSLVQSCFYQSVPLKQLTVSDGSVSNNINTTLD